MNQPINDGGPAFPLQAHGDEEKSRYYLTQQGMTLRDYFAAAALQGLLSSIEQNQLWNGEEVAVTCYRTADAMLKAREVKS